MVNKSSPWKDGRRLARTMFVVLGFFLQDLDPKQWRKQNRHKPRYQKGHADYGEERKCIIACIAFGEADRYKADDRDNRAGQHRKGGGGIGEGRGPDLGPALFQLGHHALDRDHRVIYEQAESYDQSAK